jgi:hypothetical protein
MTLLITHSALRHVKQSDGMPGSNMLLTLGSFQLDPELFTLQFCVEAICNYDIYAGFDM